MSKMPIEDALRIADVFEADDIISVPSLACRTLAKEVRKLQQQVEKLDDIITEIGERK